jgi:RNA polymerase sigma-70 factor (ECF subfamily)
MRLTIDSRRRMLRSLNLWGRLSSVRHPESTASEEIGSSDIGDALMRLPVGQQQVLVLHYFADLSVDAISQEHGIPVGTVKTRLAAGRRRLEQEMTSTKVVHDGR